MSALTPEQWVAVQELFLDTLDRSPEERTAFLEHACPDADLRQEVESLLQAHHVGNDLLDATLEELALLVEGDGHESEHEGGATDNAPPGASPPLGQAGPYRIVEEIGRGGMGIVYRAERSDEQFRREVALKVLRRGLADPDLATRFGRERQILAGLEHPGVARLYDAGLAETGEPYLAMELVRGLSIDRYCDQARLSVGDRLQLFEQVCLAVDYAHRKLVIHRDLKPSNIFVADDGVVKLLDFGIAKLLTDVAMEAAEGGPQGSESPNSPLTREDQRILTPDYASPEQLRGESLSTASDVFALGVVLHELLTGRTPLRDQDGTASTAPSVSITRPATGRSGRTDRPISPAPDPREAATARSTTPEQLSRTLQGELDALLLKALAPEPERRYPSAAALLDDLVRFREGRPISARPPSLAYRSGKFVRRHRGAVAAAAAFVTLLVGSSVALAVQQSVTARERDRAETEARTAERVTDLFVDMLTSAAPEVALGQDVTLRAFLDEAAAQIPDELGDEPAVKARLMLQLARTFDGLNQPAEARELLEDALAVAEQSPEVPWESRFEILVSLQVTEEALGNFEASEAAILEARRVLGLEGGTEVQRSTLALNQGMLYVTMGRLDEAEPLLEESVALDRAAMVGDTSTALGFSLNNLGLLRYNQGDPEAALQLLEEAVRIRRATKGPRHPETLNSAGNLASLFASIGRFAEAEPLLREALAANLDLYGEGDLEVASARQNLAFNLRGQGQLEDAEVLARSSLETRERLLGGAHPQVALSLNTLAMIAQDQGRADLALRQFRRALDIFRSAFGDAHPNTAVVAARTGRAALAVADTADAVAGLTLALEALVASRGADAPDATAVREELVTLLRDWGQTERAEEIAADGPTPAGEAS